MRGASRCTVCSDLRTRTESFNGETDEFVRLHDERLYRLYMCECVSGFVCGFICKMRTCVGAGCSTFGFVFVIICRNNLDIITNYVRVHSCTPAYMDGYANVAVCLLWDCMSTYT